MKVKTYTLTESEMHAVRNALEDYYFNVSKPALKKGVTSPFAKEIHEVVRPLWRQFKQDIITM